MHLTLLSEAAMDGSSKAADRRVRFSNSYQVVAVASSRSSATTDIYNDIRNVIPSISQTMSDLTDSSALPVERDAETDFQNGVISIKSASVKHFGQQSNSFGDDEEAEENCSVVTSDDATVIRDRTQERRTTPSQTSSKYGQSEGVRIARRSSTSITGNWSYQRLQETVATSVTPLRSGKSVCYATKSPYLRFQEARQMFLALTAANPPPPIASCSHHDRHNTRDKVKRLASGAPFISQDAVDTQPKVSISLSAETSESNRMFTQDNVDAMHSPSDMSQYIIFSERDSTDADVMQPLRAEESNIEKETFDNNQADVSVDESEVDAFAYLMNNQENLDDDDDACDDETVSTVQQDCAKSLFGSAFRPTVDENAPPDMGRGTQSLESNGNSTTFSSLLHMYGSGSSGPSLSFQARGVVKPCEQNLPLTCNSHKPELKTSSTPLQARAWRVLAAKAQEKNNNVVLR
jgi:hypothetical protein